MLILLALFGCDTPTCLDGDTTCRMPTPCPEVSYTCDGGTTEVHVLEPGDRHPGGMAALASAGDVILGNDNNPKGTRDFYPAEMAVRRRIEAAWRDASVAFGFDEIDGPTFEHLELYTAKSGEGIVFDFTGPGKVMTQTRNPNEFLGWISAMLGTSNSGAASPLGGLFGRD